MYRGTGAFGEAEIVLHQRVLGAVPAAHHAVTTFDAAGALGPGTAEERVGNGFSGFAEKHADRCLDEGVTHPHVLGDRLDDLVGRGHVRVAHHTEHALGLLVVGRQLVFPVGDVFPLRIVEERGGGLVQGVRVVQ